LPTEFLFVINTMSKSDGTGTFVFDTTNENP